MRVKTIEYSRKIGMPNYSSMSFGASAEIVKDEDLDKAVDELKQFVDKNCSPDQSWMSSDPKADIQQTTIGGAEKSNKST
jgi:hypothetical protein